MKNKRITVLIMVIALLSSYVVAFSSGFDTSKSNDVLKEKIYPKPTVTVNKNVPRIGDRIVFQIGGFSYKDKDKPINNDYGVKIFNYEEIDKYKDGWENIDSMRLDSISIPEIEVLKYKNKEWINSGSERGLFINARARTGYVKNTLEQKGSLKITKDDVNNTIENEFKLNPSYLKEYIIVSNSLNEFGESETPKIDKYNGYIAQDTIDFEYIIEDKSTTKAYGLFNGIFNYIDNSISFPTNWLYYETSKAELSIIDPKDEYESGDIVKIKVDVTNESKNIPNKYLQLGIHQGYKDYLKDAKTPEEDTLFKIIVNGDNEILPGQTLENQVEYTIPDNIDEKYKKDDNLILTPFLYTKSAKNENGKTKWFDNYEEREYDNSLFIPLKADETKIKVEFNGNGGSFNSGNIKNLYVKKGSKIDRTSVEEPKRTGYKFNGWTILKDSNSYYNFNNSVEKELTLYANWQKNEDKTPPSTGGGGGSSGGGGGSSGGSKKETPPEIKIDFDLNKLDHLAYIKGYKDQTVQPEGTLTREEAAMVFYRLLDLDYRKNVETDNHNYTDIPKGLWSEKAIGTLSKIELVNGYKDESFRPKEKITRGELSKIIAKFTETVEGETKFNDIKGHWAEEFINSVEYKKWINGYEDGSFRPNNFIKRNEFVKIMNLVLERNVDAETIPFEIKQFKDLNKGTWYYDDMVEATNGHNYTIKDKIETWTEKDDREFE